MSSGVFRTSRQQTSRIFQVWFEELRTIQEESIKRTRQFSAPDHAKLIATQLINHGVDSHDSIENGIRILERSQRKQDTVELSITMNELPTQWNTYQIVLQNGAHRYFESHRHESAHFKKDYFNRVSFMSLWNAIWSQNVGHAGAENCTLLYEISEWMRRIGTPTDIQRVFQDKAVLQTDPKNTFPFSLTTLGRIETQFREAANMDSIQFEQTEKQIETDLRAYYTAIEHNRSTWKLTETACKRLHRIQTLKDTQWTNESTQITTTSKRMQEKVVTLIRYALDKWYTSLLSTGSLPTKANLTNTQSKIERIAKTKYTDLEKDVDKEATKQAYHAYMKLTIASNQNKCMIKLMDDLEGREGVSPDIHTKINELKNLMTDAFNARIAADLVITTSEAKSIVTKLEEDTASVDAIQYVSLKIIAMSGSGDELNPRIKHDLRVFQGLKQIDLDIEEKAANGELTWDKKVLNKLKHLQENYTERPVGAEINDRTDTILQSGTSVCTSMNESLSTTYAISKQSTKVYLDKMFTDVNETTRASINIPHMDSIQLIQPMYWQSLKDRLVIQNNNMLLQRFAESYPSTHNPDPKDEKELANCSWIEVPNTQATTFTKLGKLQSSMLFLTFKNNIEQIMHTESILCSENLSR